MGCCSSVVENAVITRGQDVPVPPPPAPQTPEEPASPPPKEEEVPVAPQPPDEPAKEEAPAKRIQEVYNFERRKLGEGCSASVWRVTHKQTGAAYAVKSINRSAMGGTCSFKQEIAIMREMDHPHIVKLHDTYEDHRSIYLVMELCAGGELFNRIIESGGFTEREAAYLMKQILETLCYMHKNHICHRDLKPENFLFKTRDKIERNQLKVIDFDRSCKLKPGDRLHAAAPVSFYIAPEALAGGCTHLYDMWSCGVIMYIMLCGYPPFYGETDTELRHKVAGARLEFRSADWKKVSEDAKNLVRRLLQKDPSDRYTAEKALKDIWITGKAPNGSDAPLDLIDKLRTFGAMPKLQKAAARIIASQLTESEISELTDTFKALDKNGDGQLTMAEVKEGIEGAGLEIPGDLQQLLDHADTDRSGTIDVSEFITASIAKRHDLLERNCWAAFREFDKDGNGVISKQEIKQMLASDYFNDDDKEEAVSDILQEVGLGEGEIDFETFMKIVLRVDRKGHPVLTQSSLQGR